MSFFPKAENFTSLALNEYSLVSGGTTAGSANRNSLGVIPSGPSALKLDPSFREVNFNVLSVQSVPKNMCDFIFYKFHVNPKLTARIIMPRVRFF